MSTSATQLQWLYEHTADDTARFVLGTAGENPLVCVGVNPSTATPSKLDRTVTGVKNLADRDGYDSWIMLNLYPQRSTDPKGMHAVHDPVLKAENEQHIAALLDGKQLTLVAAWGGLITSRKYLPSLLGGIVQLTDAAGYSWMSLGDPLKEGHPRHPSRAKGDSQLQPFDMSGYMRGLA